MKQCTSSHFYCDYTFKMCLVLPWFLVKMFRAGQWRRVSSGKVGRFFSQKALKVDTTVGKLLRLESATEICSFRDSNLSAYESNLFSQEQIHIIQPQGTAKQNPKAN